MGTILKLNMDIKHVKPLKFYKLVMSNSNNEFTTTIGEDVFHYFVIRKRRDIWHTRNGKTGEVLSRSEFIEYFKPIVREDKLSKLRKKMRFNKFLKIWKNKINNG